MAITDNNPPGFFARLKQHHLYGVVVVYAIVAGFLIQLLSRVLPAFGWGAAFPAAIIILAAGFPVAVVLAWTLIRPKDPAKYTSWQKLHWKLGATLSVVIVIAAVISSYLAWHLDQRHAERLAAEQAAAQAAVKPATPAFNPPADSLVVLPFTNLSGDSKQQYFSDGITEELTGALGQNTGLAVIAWNTASTFRDPKQTVGEIGKALNVAHILDGSIQREGQKVRVSAELVSTVTGQQLWSAHYDGAFADIFKVQDQVSAAIAGALKVKFAQAELPAGGTGNPEAHELVLKGRALLNKFDAASLTAAQKLFEQAIAFDPTYADAHALLADALLAMTQRGDLPLKSVLPRIRAEADKALSLDRRNAGVWVTLGVADAGADPPNAAKARIELQKALALDPSNAAAHNDYSNLLPLSAGLAEVQEATWLSPRDEAAWNNLIVDAQDLGDWAEEKRAAETLLKLDPKIVDGAFSLAYAQLQLNQHEQAIAAFDRANPSTPLDREQIDAGRLTYRAIVDPAVRPRALAALHKLGRFHSNQDVVGNLLMLYLSLDETVPALELLEGSCPSDPIGCSDLAVNPMYRALHGNPRFEALSKKYTTLTVQ